MKTQWNINEGRYYLWTRLACVFVTFIFLIPSRAAAETLSVNCNAGETIGGALKTLKPGDTLLVSGVCSENVEVAGPSGQFDGVTLAGGEGTATIRGSQPSTNTLQLTGVRNFTVKGFRITGGRDGIVVNSGQMIAIENNTIEQVGRHGLQVQRGTNMSHVINTVIRNNPQHGIMVNENSYLRIGFTSGVGASEGDTGANTIQDNGGHGIHIQRVSMARIYVNTIKNNGQNGVNVEKFSFAEIAANTIEGNKRNGVQATQNSGVHLGTDTGSGNENRPNSSANPNGQYGIDLSLGAYAEGRLGSLTGAKGARHSVEAYDSLLPEDSSPVATHIRFDATNILIGTSFTATVSGSNLSAETYFDVRFHAPDGTADQVAYNWQQGTSFIHRVGADIPGGTWTITGIRAHRDANDHTGPFSPVTASLNVIR